MENIENAVVEDNVINNDNKNENTKIEPTAQMLNRLRYFRFGKIFSRISITSLILISALLLSIIVLPIAQIFAITVMLIIIVCSIIFTLGYIFVLDGNPLGKMWEFLKTIIDLSGKSIDIINFIVKLIPYLSIISIIFSALSIVMLYVGKQKSKIGKTILYSILILVAVIVLILYFILGGTL